MIDAGLSLTDAVKAAAGSMKSPRKGRNTRAAEPSMTQELRKVASHKRRPPATRTGRKGIVIYFDQHVAAAIRRLGADYQASNQELGEMAFKYLFEKFGEPWPA